jgi:GTP-binding protein Era
MKSLPVAWRPDMDTRCGIVALAGRPNVGKSTLVNALAGGKVAAVTDRPQTTRRAIRGVWTSGERQLVLVDLPGVGRPRDLLTERMSARVAQEVAGADAILMMLAADSPVGAGDRFIARMLAEAPERTPVTIAVNKVDRAKPAQAAGVLQAAEELGVAEEIFPISARTGEGVAELVAHLASLAPPGPFLFEPGQRSDQPLELAVAEVVREALMRRTYQELPHAAEVAVEAIERPRAGLVAIRALIWVESRSQQGIVVGARGRMIKAIGSAARRELERELGEQVHLDLSVRMRRHWRTEPAILDRLGIT